MEEIKEPTTPAEPAQAEVQPLVAVYADGQVMLTPGHSLGQILDALRILEAAIRGIKVG